MDSVETRVHVAMCLATEILWACWRLSPVASFCFVRYPSEISSMKHMNVLFIPEAAFHLCPFYPSANIYIHDYKSDSAWCREWCRKLRSFSEDAFKNGLSVDTVPLGTDSVPSKGSTEASLFFSVPYSQGISGCPSRSYCPSSRRVLYWICFRIRRTACLMPVMGDGWG